MKTNSDLAYLRQLCCSGLPKEVVLPEFLKAVQQVIPSSNNVFTGCTADLIPLYHFLEHTPPELIELVPEIVPYYFTPEKQARYVKYWRKHAVSTEVHAIDRNFYKSDLYNLIWRACDQHHYAQSPAYSNGRICGMLHLYRPHQQKPFNQSEQNLCVRLMPYVAHALQDNAGGATIQRDETNRHDGDGLPRCGAFSMPYGNPTVGVSQLSLAELVQFS